MAQTCIYTLDPAEGGGVPAKMREVVNAHTRFGHNVRLIYNATSQLPAGRWEALRYILRARPDWQTFEDLRGFGLPYWPLSPWAVYLMPLLLASPVIRQSHMHIAVSGSNHCGLTPALLGKKFIVWIGTLYEEELAGKAEAGDAWARRVLHSPSRPVLAWEEKLIFDRATLILINGAHTARNVETKFPNVAGRVRVIIYPVDTATFHPDPVVRIQSPHPYLLFTGRINDPRKNMPMLFRAFTYIRARHPSLKLRLAGDPPSPAVLKALAESGAGGGLEFMGRLSRESLLKLYQGAELFVLPSSQEGLGISMLEAMACGAPVVSTRCGGPESIIAHGETGWLVENNNPEAFSEAVMELLADPDRLETMRTRCVQVAETTFSKDVVEKKLLEAFHVVYPEHFPPPL